VRSYRLQPMTIIDSHYISLLSSHRCADCFMSLAVADSGFGRQFPGEYLIRVFRSCQCDIKCGLGWAIAMFKWEMVPPDSTWLP